ncbi:hypothetical protein HTH_0394 [Hydrogenobacter thermophilus TK-6]|uniref:Uncharacterized protein n=1 Tax=Hydrogenobacter thermophilus (strain DSM 6534 / IAM 12695 / TK-6) TaxID=608538 RepID=D3DGA7_HYDTT|nr:hypothetical protein HTH_0394 [Hydrogenobacter thermophilus TK-6]
MKARIENIIERLEREKSYYRRCLKKVGSCRQPPYKPPSFCRQPLSLLLLRIEI